MNSLWSLLRFKSIRVSESNRSENKGIESTFTDKSKETEKMNKRNNQSNEEVVRVSQSALLWLLESFWELLFPYLSLNDICKLDIAVTEKSLREVYFSRLGTFYTTHSIYSANELEWILKRGVKLAVCRLEFDYIKAIENGKRFLQV